MAKPFKTKTMIAKPKSTEGVWPIVFVFLFAFILLFRSETFLDPDLALRWIGLTMFIAVVLFFQSGESVIFKDKKTIISFFILLVYEIFIGFQSVNSGLAIDSITKFALGWFLVLLLINVDVKKMMEPLLYISTIICIWTLFALTDMFLNRGFDLDFTYGVEASSSHRNILSATLCSLFPFILLNSISSKSHIRKISLFNLLLIPAIIIILHTRSIYLAGGIGIFIFTLVIFLKEKGNWNQWRMPFLFILISIFIGCVFYFSMDNSQKKTAVKQEKEIVSSAEDRLIIWEKTFELIKDNPLTGLGPGQWMIYFPSAGLVNTNAEKGELNYTRPHNEYLRFLSESGMIGVILTIVFIFFLISAVKKRIGWNIETYIGFFVIWNISVYAFFEFPFERAEFHLLLSLGISLVFSKSIQENNFKTSKFKFIFIAISFVCFMVFLVQANADQKGLELLMARKKLQHDKVLELVNQTDGQFVSIDRTGTPLRFYSGSIYWEKGDLLNAEKEFLLAEKNQPFHFHTLNNLGSVYFLKNDFIKSEFYYLKALKINKNDPDAAMNLAVVRIQGKLKNDPLEGLVQCNLDLFDANQQAKFVQIMGVIHPEISSDSLSFQKARELLPN